jgi:predicted transcriptional regulator
LLLSVRPEHAEAILEGRKTVELRRRRVSAAPGTAVVLYATHPTGAVVGKANVREAITCSREDAWSRHSGALAIDRAAFDAYMEGASSACLLVLEGAARIDPVTLAALRSGAPFRPPQSYRFVSAGDPAVIRELAGIPA